MLSKNTTTSDDSHMYVCEKCNDNSQNPPYAPYVVFQSLFYFNSLLNCHPLHIQLLSFLDIYLHIQNRERGFYNRKIVETSHLNNLLLSYDNILDQDTIVDEISTKIGHILTQNMSTNPWYKTYKCIFEQAQKNTGICVLSANIVSKVMEIHSTSSPTFDTMNVPESLYEKKEKKRKNIKEEEKRTKKERKKMKNNPIFKGSLAL